MNTNVVADTNRLKKKQAIAFRRLMTGKAPSIKMREYVGLNYLELKEWISSQMLRSMNWNNYGQLWVICHIVSLSFFDLSKDEDCKLAWNYRNLLPVLVEDVHAFECQTSFSLRYLRSLDKGFVTDRLIDILSEYQKELEERYKSYPE